MLKLIIMGLIVFGIYILIKAIRSKEFAGKGFLITHLNGKAHKMISFGYSVRQVNNNLYEVS